MKKIIAICAAFLLLASCGDSGTEKLGDIQRKVSFLVFGDSGYHYDYQKQELYDKPFTTLDDFVDDYRADWIEDQRPLSEFEMPPTYFHEEMGGYVMTSGMKPVATAMESYCSRYNCNFALLTGDNIYPNGATLGADGKDDAKRFQDMFTDPYKALGRLDDRFKVYATLGNHDWNTSREGALAQVEFMQASEKFYMDGFFYSVKPPAGNGDIEIFVIDTELLLSQYGTLEAILNPDGSEKTGHIVPEERDPWTVPQTDDERAQLTWFENALQASTAKWKFVVAHHPIWSSGGTKFEQARTVRKYLMPSLCKYADAYFAGHEHSLELHTDTCETTLGAPDTKPLVQVVSGAAGKQRAIHKPFKAYQDANYPQNTAHFVKGMTWGFSHVEVKGDTAMVRMISTPTNGNGKPVVQYVHTFENRGQ